eukprot:CAMPEP_0174254292 /NCGR_PEP_ID=MMETSP0439-20130205/3628_1 /TAXON_ID=0 /ORGANISM="Stereomyxa ramosa, Strain Chinc5" /LENGTH=194 /DNA_ID=CAMNT_0015335799 /DNA_START=107 /DNA_END=691 /DNA_ORIENTATION=-
MNLPLVLCFLLAFALLCSSKTAVTKEPVAGTSKELPKLDDNPKYCYWTKGDFLPPSPTFFDNSSNLDMFLELTLFTEETVKAQSGALAYCVRGAHFIDPTSPSNVSSITAMWASGKKYVSPWRQQIHEPTAIKWAMENNITAPFLSKVVVCKDALKLLQASGILGADNKTIASTHFDVAFDIWSSLDNYYGQEV